MHAQLTDACMRARPTTAHPWRCPVLLFGQGRLFLHVFYNDRPVEHSPFAEHRRQGGHAHAAQTRGVHFATPATRSLEIGTEDITRTFSVECFISFTLVVALDKQQSLLDEGSIDGFVMRNFNLRGVQ